MSLRFIFPLLLASLIVYLTILTGCARFTTLDPSGNYTDIGDSSIIVIGVTPRCRVQILENIIENWNVTLNVYPEGGYIVSKLPARSDGKNYEIARVIYDWSLYYPCSGMEALVFEAPMGKIVYVGDISLTFQGDHLRMKVSRNYAAALRHLQEKYPSLADRLTDQEYEIRETFNDVPCIPYFNQPNRDSLRIY